ncbi:MAG TPA: arginine--tRNA ligase [Chitinophagaceae bacterium]|nr:arginine--tRNA ligase [Chitinophagaceae bacterium]
MSLVTGLKEYVATAIAHIYTITAAPDDILVNETKPEFEGDYTIVLFSLIKRLKLSPDALGTAIGTYLIENHPHVVTHFNIIKGFLNLTIADAFFTEFLLQTNTEKIEPLAPTGKKIIVEYASPNTNKPLHLGHLRNIFLGWSVSQILKAAGNDVFKTCIVNDRGVHICKSMIAWEKFSGGATPQSTGIKGDHLVGDYYVRFNEAYKKEVDVLIAQGIPKETAEREAPIMQQTQQMLLDWEQGKPEVMTLWKEMNSWVYEGFEETYKRIGIHFDKTYYESETYLLGKKFVELGLEKGVLYKKDDGSVWIDLRAEGLDEKLLLRRDGTSVYITQDLGLALQKHEDYPYDQSIYVIGDEQNYHMKVLKGILQKLHMPFADGIYHLSYGMVELPSGRMKSREGTVVDADDLVEEMTKEAAKKTAEHSNIETFTEAELKDLYEMIGLGALKFFLLRVDPKKKMVFNPEESIDFHGFTGPFIQYTYARIRSILRKSGAAGSLPGVLQPLLPLEKTLLLLLEQYPLNLQQAASEHNPSVLANYIFTVAKTYNTFYAEHPVMRAESEEKKALRLQLCIRTAQTIAHAMDLLGIQVPERM